MPNTGYSDLRDSLMGLGDSLVGQSEKRQQFQQALQSMIFEAKLKQMYDPEAQFRQQIMGLISGSGQGGQPMPQPRPQAPISLQNIPGAAMSLSSGGIGNLQGQPIDLASALSRMQSQAQPQAQPQAPAVGGGFRLGGINVGGMNLERIPTSQEVQGDIDKKVQEKLALKQIEDPTQAQETTGLYAKRMEQSNKVFDVLGDKLSHLGAGAQVQQWMPGFMNFLKSSDFQSYEQAQRNFLNAVLRRESGAVISPTEFSEGRAQYFPQPGDKPEVIAQKKANRDVVIRSFIQGARKAYIQDDFSQSSAENQGQQGAPSVGSMFNGEKVIKVRKIR